MPTDAATMIAMAQVVSLGAPVTDKLSVSGDLWGGWDFGFGRARRGSTLPMRSVAYVVSSSVQVDAGANFGLNRQTPDVELYTGVSARF